MCILTLDYHPNYARSNRNVYLDRLSDAWHYLTEIRRVLGLAEGPPARFWYA